MTESRLTWEGHGLSHCHRRSEQAECGSKRSEEMAFVAQLKQAHILLSEFVPSVGDQTQGGGLMALHRLGSISTGTRVYAGMFCPSWTELQPCPSVVGLNRSWP